MTQTCQLKVTSSDGDGGGDTLKGPRRVMPKGNFLSNVSFNYNSDFKLFFSTTFSRYSMDVFCRRFPFLGYSQLLYSGSNCVHGNAGHQHRANYHQFD